MKEIILVTILFFIACGSVEADIKEMKRTLTPLDEISERMDKDDVNNLLYLNDRCTAVYLIAWKWTKEAPRGSWVRDVENLNLDRDFEKDLEYLRKITINTRAMVEFGNMDDQGNIVKSGKIYTDNYNQILNLYKQKQLFFRQDMEWDDDFLTDYFVCDEVLLGWLEFEREMNGN